MDAIDLRTLFEDGENQSRHWTDLRSGPLDRSTGPCTGPDLSCGPVDRISTGVQWTVH
jgi:hypothetical protein